MPENGTDRIWPDDYSKDELIDEAAYGVMEGINEGGHSWENDDLLRSFAEYGIGGVPLDESHIDEIVDRAKEQYAPIGGPNVEPGTEQ